MRVAPDRIVASKIILAASLAALLGAYLSNSTVIALAAVASATGALVMVLPQRRTVSGLVMLWIFTLLTAAPIVAIAIPAQTMITSSTVRFIIHSSLFAIVTISLWVIYRKRGPQC